MKKSDFYIEKSLFSPANTYSFMKHILIFYTLILSVSHLYGQRYTISGNISDASSGEMLISANIYDLVSQEGGSSNEYGFYSVTFPTGEVEMHYSYIGYESIVLTFNLLKDTTLNIALKPSTVLEEVVITGEAKEKVENRTQMSTIEIPIKQIKKIPTLLGETDVFKAIQLLPGVQSGGEGQSGLYIRGGSPDQNLVLLDGVPVYNAAHLFGFFSVFNTDAIRDVRLIKGGIPARYGGRLSSVLDISMKEGNIKELKGSASVGLISSKVTLEGPILKDRTSFMVSARRTYLDLLARPIIKQSYKNNDKTGVAGYYFYDFNGKINHKLTDNDRIYFSIYSGRDALYQNSKDIDTENQYFEDNNLNWGNITSSLRWNRLWTPKLFSNSILTFSRFKLGTDFTYGQRVNDTLASGYGLDYGSGIRDFSAKIAFDYIPNTSNSIKFGFQIIRHHFTPGTFDLSVYGKDGYEKEITQADIDANEYALYMENDMKISDNIKLNYGLHGSGFQVNNEFYSSLQPRVGLRCKASKSLSLKASYTRMRQYINLLSFEGVGLPTDLWLPATDRVLPQDSWQMALGAARTFEEFELSAEAYYKDMTNLLSYNEGSGVFETGDWQDRVSQGDGKSYGFELLLQRKQGRLNGWIGYTWSKSDRTFENINRGRTYPFKYDRRHDISIVANYELRPNIDISGAWVYGTGNAVTLSGEKYRVAGSDLVFSDNDYNRVVQNIQSKNNFRMRDYHRLDLGISFKKEKKRGVRTWSVGFYNLYARANPLYIFLGDKEVKSEDGIVRYQPTLKQVTLFPCVPYVTYKFDF